MALMRADIDQQLVGGLASGGTFFYTHALPYPPDTIQVRFSVLAGATLSFIGIHAYTTVASASNGIMVQNAGNDPSPDMEITAICFHSMIQ